jgi:serine/threonine protein kinase
MKTDVASARSTRGLESAFPGWEPSLLPWRRELPHRVFQPADPRVRGMVTVVEHRAEIAEARHDRPEAAPRRPSGMLEVGSIVDKYRIEQVLGHGAFATVYRATHLILQKQVALKLLHRHLLLKDPRFVDLLCEESRHTAQLDHPNVVRVFDVTRASEATYIVLEWVDGESLSKHVRRRGALSSAATVRVAQEVCAGLEAALARGLVHRDIKPSNVLLQRDGGVKIIDLGLARHDLTRSALGRDAVVGTPGYMAPEQATAAQSVDFRADIYSLGGTLYFARSGRLPMRIKTVEEVRRLGPSDQPRPLQEVAPDTPEALVRLVHAMMAFSPKDRPANYAELRRLLAAIA